MSEFDFETWEETEEEDGFLHLTTCLYPSFYPEFRCIADRCHNTCCQDWTITLTRKEYMDMQRLFSSKKSKEMEINGVRRFPKKTRTAAMYAKFVLREDKMCPYYREGLCGLQLTYGEEILSTVCQTFPRKSAWNAMGKIRSLTIGCEAVVELLMAQKDGISFVEDPLPPEEWRREERTTALTWFLVLHTKMIDILQARNFPLSHRLLLLGHVLGEALQSEWYEDVGRWMEMVDELLDNPSLSQGLGELSGDANRRLGKNILVAMELEESYIQKQVQNLGAEYVEQEVEGEGKRKEVVFPKETYYQIEEAFDQTFGDLSYLWENLLVHFCFDFRLPDTETYDKVWRSYLELCLFYNMIRFYTVLECGLEPTREKLISGIVMVARDLLHNEGRRKRLIGRLLQNEKTDLKSMALWVCHS